MVNVLKGLLFLLIMFTVGHLTGEAAPTFGTLNPTYKHGMTTTWESQKKMAIALKNSDLLKKPSRPEASQRRCPYKFEVSKPQYNRFPKHIVEATCKGCDMKRCEPVYYHLQVRISKGQGHYWKPIRVKVAYVDKRLC